MSLTATSQLPPKLGAMVETELRPGEQIVWLDQPIPERMARQGLPMVLFGIPWTAFAIFWMVMAFRGTMHEGGPGIVFPLFGVPFVLIGLGMLTSPFWLRRGARLSVYVLTERRAIIFRSSYYGGINVRSFEPERLTDLQRKQNPDGSGDLIFTMDTRRDSEGHQTTTNVGFLAVRDVKQVEEQVRALVQKAKEEQVEPPPRLTPAGN